MRLVGMEEEPVDLMLPKSGSQVIFQHGRLQVISQLVDGNFPDYKMILPKSHKTKITVSTEGLLKACKQAEIIARDGQNVIHLKAEGEELRVSATAEETGLERVTPAGADRGRCDRNCLQRPLPARVPQRGEIAGSRAAGQYAQNPDDPKPVREQQLPVHPHAGACGIGWK